MRADPIRLKSYLAEIRRSSLDLKKIIHENEMVPDSIPLKAAKYILIELAEAMSGTIQHILAKEKGVPVSGYIDTVVKGYENGILSQDLFQKLKPFFDFRNSLIHRYWQIDDKRLIENIKTGYHDFDIFIDEIEAFLDQKGEREKKQ
jgi:uncharacterized protein YutE (UPF0331/DUF86 family)